MRAIQLFAFVCLMALSGCCYTHYQDSRICVSRISFGVESQAHRIVVTAGEQATTIRVGALDSSGAESVGAAVGTILRVK